MDSRRRADPEPDPSTSSKDTSRWRPWRGNGGRRPLWRLKLHWWIFLGMIAGAAWGTALNVTYLERFAAEARVEVLGDTWTTAEEIAATPLIQAAVERRFRGTVFGGMAHAFGRIFLSLLMMVVIPLVFSSLVAGIAAMESVRRLGRIGSRAAAWYITTSLLAILTGLTLVNFLQPGRNVELPIPAGADVLPRPDSGWDLLLAFFPSNPVRAMADFDLLHVIFFAILFGVFLLRVTPDLRDPVVRFFQGVFEVMMKMTLFIILLAPVGIAALIAFLVARTGPGVFIDLAGYAGTVALALALHLLVVLPALFWLLTRQNPYRVMRAMSPALMTAFSTASSAGTLPLTMEGLQKEVGVGNRTTSFVLPLGATVNMDGTALYECVATLFIAQAYAFMNPEFTLTIGTQLVIVLLALAVSIGAAGIPHAGLVMMVIIFTAVGLPVELTALLWAVDRPLDMARTMTNVWSDTLGTTVIAIHEGDVAPGSLVVAAAGAPDGYRAAAPAGEPIGGGEPR
jgi:proton glutamate symport protein